MMVGGGVRMRGAILGIMRTYGTIKEVAGFVSRDERTIRRWIADGHLTVVVGRTGQRGVCVQDALQVERAMRRSAVTRHRDNVATTFGPAGTDDR